MSSSAADSLGAFLAEEGAAKGMYSDILLRVTNKVIPERVSYERRLHKLILCQSPYLQRRIGGAAARPAQAQADATLEVSVVDPNVTTAAVERAVSVLYGGPLPELLAEELLPTLGAAMLLEFPRLVRHCVSCAVSHFHPSTLEDIIQWSKLYPGSGLWEECVYFLARNCSKLCHTKAFQTMPTALMLALCRSEECDFSSSKRKFEVVQAYRLRNYPDQPVDGIDSALTDEELAVLQDDLESGESARTADGSKFPLSENEAADMFAQLAMYEKLLFDEVTFASKIAMAAGMGDNQDHLDVHNDDGERPRAPGQPAGPQQAQQPQQPRRKVVKFAADRCIEILTELSNHGELKADDELHSDILYVMDTIVNNRMHEMYHGKESSQQTTIVEGWLQQDKKNRLRRKRRKSEQGLINMSFLDPGRSGADARVNAYELFPDLDAWQFDIFKANLDCGGTPLLHVALEIFGKYNLTSRFCAPGVLDAFLKRIESGYMPNPYHNKTHAADVLQTMHHMLLSGGILEHLTDIEVFAALIAAIIHDHEHPGLNQNFLVNTGASHAITYNDQTVLEMHHVCSVYKVRARDTPGCADRAMLPRRSPAAG